MADLPSELFTEILSRLPPQSLLRFRSISKSLKYLIDSHNFTNLHLKNSLNFNLILRQNLNLYQLDFPNLTAAIPLNHPFTHCRPHILGSCNGLLCISNSDNEIAIWNPNIRKHWILPYLPIIPRSKYDILLFRVHGFAFDPFSLDYKLVQISSLFNSHHHTCYSHVRLFSSKTNSWKELPSMLDAFSSAQTMGVFVENSLHWVVTGNLRTRLILAFNITQEIFNKVPLPEIQVANNKICKIVVSLLGKCLCMTVNYRTPNNVDYQTSKFDVWVMKEYGFRDSWCKLFTLGEWYNKPLRSLKPLGYSSYRSKVLLQVECKKLSIDSISKNLLWYDLKSEKATCVPGIPNFNEAMIYVGSLLRPSLPIDNYNYRK